jgi:hypothetical protein
MPASEANASVAQAAQVLTSQTLAPPTGVAASLPTTSEACIPCSLENEVVCIGSYHYGLCNLNCARSQLLAPGTVCTNGQILKRVR